MRLSVLFIALVLATSPTYGQKRERDRNDTDAVTRACSVEDCFREADVREFEIIDRTHVIVYVGSQRCAFHLEVRGALCDLSFAPELYFRRTNEVPLVTGRPQDLADPTRPRTATRPTDFDSFAIGQRERVDLEICGNDLMIQVHGGQWTESQSSGVATDRFGNANSDCRISSVRSVTDDQLLEFYVGRGVLAPVPPMGPGEIEIGEQEEQGTVPADRDRSNAD
jgi:hypothetical protein